MLNLVRLKSVPILEQLHLEEALLRCSQDDFLLINEGAPPAVVMGISAKREEVVDEEQRAKLSLPLIRRYTGGGTVVVEPNTVFLSLVLNHKTANVKPFPKEILQFTEGLIKGAFASLPFVLRENDFAIGEKKCAGNAEYLTKNRFVHHMTFLFDFSHELMTVLPLPPKMPAYRNRRSHADFLHPLHPHFTSKEAFAEALVKEIAKTFEMQEISKVPLQALLTNPHRRVSERVL